MPDPRAIVVCSRSRCRFPAVGAVVLLVSFLLGMGMPLHGQWTKHTIDNALDGAAGLALADMDGDGDLDVVASGYEANILLWYEAPTWSKHIIDATLVDAADLAVADMWGDEAPDVVATQYTGSIRLYEAPFWVMHPIDASSTGTQNVAVADMDGDGDLDVVAAARDANDVRWYEAPSWTSHLIDADLAGGRGLTVVDLDGDDTLDVVAAGMYANQVVWYEGPGWTKHLVDSSFAGAIDIAIADTDGDGLGDIVAAGLYADKVVVYRAPAWTREDIDGNLDGARQVSVVDVDGDDDLDVVATGMNANTVVWYEAPSMAKRVIDASFQGAYFIRPADMDGDGDVDVVADAHYDDEVVWYENPTIGNPQLYLGSFPVDGTVREYIVFLPQSYQAGMPVVFNLHGYTDNAAWQMEYTQMNAVADTAGFLVVYPNAIWPGFSTGIHRDEWINQLPDVDDVAFMSALIDTVKALFDIDMSRIYCCGYSNGGLMTEKLLLQLGHRFAAGGSVASCMLDTIAAEDYAVRDFPMLVCNGTADVSVLYDGGGPGDWSVPQTVAYWVEQNACLLPADSLALPDLDPADSCTVDRFTYRTASGEARVIQYRVNGGGHSWPRGFFDWESAKPTNRDINLNEELWEFFRDFENPLVDAAFGESISVYPHYVSPQGDTLSVAASIRNTADHPVTLYALFEGLAGATKDSIQLFDDGQHGDGAPADNVWGGAWVALGGNEEMHRASLITVDGSLGSRHRFYKSAGFTTVGPVMVDGYAIVGTDTSAAPGKIMSYRISLRNFSPSATVHGITAKVRCLDSAAYVQSTELSYGDLAPGESLTSSSYVRVRYYPTCPQNHLAQFAVEILSDGTAYWEDTFVDLVSGLAVSRQDLPLEFALEQNYPNPFNPITTITYELPEASRVTLRIFNALGQEVATLVNRVEDPGYKSLQWDAGDLASGVYLCRFQAGDVVQIRKLLLMR